MQPLTYRRLMQLIAALSQEQKDCIATIYLPDSDEFLPIHQLVFQDGTDVLDDQHPYLTVE